MDDSSILMCQKTLCGCDKYLKWRKGFFWLVVSEVLFYGQLTLLFWPMVREGIMPGAHGGWSKPAHLMVARKQRAIQEVPRVPISPSRAGTQ
jgi:hypothetical protein